MFFKAVSIVLLACFCALLVAAKPAPSEEHYTKCRNVGTGAGCSGCNAPNIDCEWCVDPDNQYDGSCLPEGFCEDNDLVAAPQVCPNLASLGKEPLFRGVEVSTADAMLFSPGFDSHFCEFPQQPWIVDRTSNPLGNNDPAGNCRRVNDFSGVGQRSAIESCLNGPQDLKRTDDTKGEYEYTGLTEKRKECIRLYQSLACTVHCPAYGKAVDFKQLCPEYCERFYQHCDATVLHCLEQVNAVPLFTEKLDCAEKGDETCFRPDLIPASGQFEAELCFYGDKKKCKDVDCSVELSSAKWADVFPGLFNTPSKRSVEDASQLSLIPFDADTSAGPCCVGPEVSKVVSGDPVTTSTVTTTSIFDSFSCTFITSTGTSYYTVEPTELLRSVGLLYKVTPGTAGGLTCEEVIENQILDSYNDKIFGSDFSVGCPPLSGYCVAQVVVRNEAGTPQFPDLDNCRSGDYHACPSTTQNN